MKSSNLENKSYRQKTCTKFGFGFEAKGKAEDMSNDLASCDCTSSVAVDLTELWVAVGIPITLSKVWFSVPVIGVCFCAQAGSMSSCCQVFVFLQPS